MSHQILPTGVIFNDLLKARTHKARVSGNHIHIYNVTTGVTEFILKKDSTGNTRLAEHLMDGNKVFVEEEILMSTVTVPKRVAYSEVLLELICDRIIEGESLKKICNSPGMPAYPQLCNWRRNIPGVEEKIAQSREDRGEYLRDMAMEEMDSVDEDNVAAVTAKHKALVWAAGVDNGRFSPKAKVEATFNTPTQILVYTGIGVDNGQMGQTDQNKQVLVGREEQNLAVRSRAEESAVLVDSVAHSPDSTTGVTVHEGGT